MLASPRAELPSAARGAAWTFQPGSGFLRSPSPFAPPHPISAGGLTWPPACREGRTKTPTHLTAATALAVSTQGPQEAVDHLDGTDKYLNRPYDQQDGEEGQMPGNHVVRLLALAP